MTSPASTFATHARDTRLTSTGYTYEQPKRHLPFPISPDEARPFITQQIDRMLSGAECMMNMAIGCEPYDFELACEMRDAAELLRDQALSSLCSAWVESVTRTGHVVDRDFENEVQANALCARRDEILQTLNEAVGGTRAIALLDELAEIGMAIDKMFLPIETVADARREARFGKGL
jgi:hypothetical protein